MTALKVQAIQWDGARESIEEIAKWVNADDDLMDEPTIQYCFSSESPSDVFDVRIWVDNDYDVVNPGDWVVRALSGDFMVIPVSPR